MEKTVSFLGEVLKTKTDKMANENISALSEQIRQIAAQLQESELKREELEHRVDTMNTNERSTIRQADMDDEECNEPDITPELTSGDEIQLESYRAIPEFSGRQHEYRSWRNQVYRRMNIIRDYQTHPKYEAALSIIRAKITGTAADILTNNKTPYNITCILRTLDSAYTDQRPLYAIEAEMVSIKQNDRNLHQFYNMINFALNAIISKVVMTYRIVEEQRSLIMEAQKKAIRTFIVGLKFRTMRHILYGQQPKTLQEAYTIARTVFYDNEHLQLEHSSTAVRHQPQTGHNKPRNEWNQLKGHNNHNEQSNRPRNEWHQARQHGTFEKPTPMEIGGSNRTNWRQQEAPQKREYNSSRQRFEQPNKIQRVNNLIESTESTLQELMTDDGNESDDSTRTNMSSTFLDE